MNRFNPIIIAATLSIYISCCFLTVPLYAQTTSLKNVTNEFEFSNLKFGQSPTPDMICVNGPCLSQDQATETRKVNQLFATYKKQKDITNYKGVEITSPKYQFFQNKLARIIFEVDCASTEERSCLRETKETLTKTYDAWLAKSVSQSAAPFNHFEAQIFTTESNEIIEFLWILKSNSKRRPFVKIYQKDLIDSARLAANPNYYPKEISN